MVVFGRSVMQIGDNVELVNPGDSVNSSESLESIHIGKKKKVDSVPLLLVVLGMHIAFFAIWWGGTITRGQMAGLGVQRYEAVAYALIFLGSYLAFFSGHGGKIWRQSRYRRWLGLYSGLVVLMVLRSFTSGASLLALFRETMPFLLVAVVFIGQNKAYWRTLNNTFLIHTAVGVVYSILVLVTVSLGETTAPLTRGLIWTQTDVMLAKNLLYAVPFLVVSYPAQARLGRTISVLGLLLVVVLGVLSQTRAVILWAVLALLLGGYIGFRVKSFMKTYGKVLLRLAVVLGIIVLLFGGGSLERLGVSASWESLLSRFTGSQGVIHHTLGDARIYEAKLVVSTMSWDDWLLGRGVSARWSSSNMYSGETRSMVHIGYLHLIFVGGVGLVLLFAFFPLGVAWRLLLTSRDVGTLAAASIVVLYSVSLLYAGAPQAGLWFVLIFLCAGKMAVGTAKPHKGSRNLTRPPLSRRDSER